MRTKIHYQGRKRALLVMAILAAAASTFAQCPPYLVQNFDGMRAPLAPTGWVTSQGVNVTGAPPWVITPVTPHTIPNDFFSSAPDNLLDNRLETPELPTGPFSFQVVFENNYNLESGADGGVLEVSHSNINGGAFTDITDPAVNGGFISGGYNGLITSASSPIAGRMAWTGDSGGYINTRVNLGNAASPSGDCKVRFRLVSDNSGASAGWRIDTFSVPSFECNSPTPSPSPTPTATPIASPCGSPNVIADSTFEAGTPWSNWTVQTSTNFGTPLCNRAACGTTGGVPYAGDNWAWFGGANVPETATLGQSVPIMAGGTATLNFVMWKTNNSGPSTDVLNVRVDGTIVQSYPEGGQFEVAYSSRTIDLSAFADGGTHLILFEYIGPTTGLTSYLVDNVFLTFGPCSTPTPSPTVTPTATPTATATVTATPIPSPSDCPPFPPGCSTPTPTASPTVPPTPTPSPTATPSPGPAQAMNISTRLRVETGDRIMIGGFIVTGTGPRRVALRGIGPSLANSGLSDVLGDPTLELRGHDGALLAQNDDWQDDPAQAAQLTSLGLALQNPDESGIVATLDPGAYTALMAGKNQTSGLGLVEIYNAEPAGASQLANLSTRGFVRTGDNVMIGGFILGHGSANADVVVRALGPSLSRFMLVDVVPDPTLELRDSNGALLIANDNWRDDPASAAQLTARNLQLFHDAESGIFVSLPPGAFTAIMAGQNGGVGIGLVELYRVHSLVTNTADSGPGSLRDAIAAARDGDTIQFDPALVGQAINLTSGELLIDKSITIKGFELYPLLVRNSTSGTTAFRVFHIAPGHTVMLQGLAIADGDAQGGFPANCGGGIYNDGSTLAIVSCAITGNRAGSTGIPGAGAGIFNNSINSGHADLTITRSDVSGNEAFGNSSGGGIHNNGAGQGHHATLVLNETTIRWNSASSGAGIYNNGFHTGNASLVVNNSTISGNSATNGGGGISNTGTFMSGQASLTVSNSTISSNSARIGGAILNSGAGGSAMLEIANSTMSENSAVEHGGGLYNADGTVSIRNTVLKAGTSGENIYNLVGAVTSAGYNLSSDDGGGFLTAAGDQIDTNPMLGPLEDNFGPTLTHKLLTGSPAIDAGDPNFAPPPSYDQRGPAFPRVIGGRIDVGSFEFRP